MKIPPVKGTRDFYPPEMAIRNKIVYGWIVASLRNGFEEYDGPIFEYLKMYQIKSGDEIAEQLFNFTDRGDRKLAIRPEITPTLARMVNQQINSLPRPIKWFSVPRLCRAERPQKGRLREFFQWNIDIIGIDDVLADAEVIFTAIDYLQSMGLTDKDIVVKISSRKMLAELLKRIGIKKNHLESLYAILDKKSKMPDDAFQKLLAKEVADSTMRSQILSFMELDVVYKIAGIVGPTPELDKAIVEMETLFNKLKLMGVYDFCEFDPSIVRGLAYYTGIVFEIYDKQSQLRAIGGGGRYDNLLKQFGGPQIPATGMGMGDCVLEILLKEKGLLDETIPTRQLHYFVVCVVPDFSDDALRLVSRLRKKGYFVNFSYKATGLKKQLKQASAENAEKAIIIGEEFENNQLVIKDMKSGDQNLVDIEEYLSKLSKRYKTGE